VFLFNHSFNNHYHISPPFFLPMRPSLTLRLEPVATVLSQGFLYLCFHDHLSHSFSIQDTRDIGRSECNSQVCKRREKWQRSICKMGVIGGGFSKNIYMRHFFLECYLDSNVEMSNDPNFQKGI